MVGATLFSRLDLFICFIFFMQSALLLSSPTLCSISLLCLPASQSRLPNCSVPSFPWKKTRTETSPLQTTYHPSFLCAVMEKVLHEASFWKKELLS